MSFMRGIFNKVLDVPAHERIKILMLAACYFCILATYNVIRELRDALFVNIVGCEYIQYAQIFSIVFLIPTLFVYAYLVDRLKKHQLLYVYTTIYAIGGLIIAYYVGHPTIGILNTQAQASRWFGWLMFLFVESYPAFVMSLFLSYVNSVTPQTTMKQSYSVIVAGSKLGGIIMSLFAWWFLGSVSWSEVSKIQTLFIIASGCIVLIPLLIRILIKKVPDAYLHGYEASYQHDQKVEKEEQKEPQRWYSGLLKSFSGLTYILKYPYALGIFGIVLFWEILNIMLGFQRLKACYALHKSISGLSGTLFMQTFWIHLLGFFIALIGTRVFLEYLGERRSLIMVPAITGILIVFYFLSSTVTGLILCFILIRSFNFSLGISVREALYIPTTKVMRFKTKSWIDTFGAKCARGTGSVCSLVAECTPTHLSQIYLSICLGIIGVWVIIAHFMGKRFENVIKDNQVIG